MHDPAIADLSAAVSDASGIATFSGSVCAAKHFTDVLNTSLLTAMAGEHIIVHGTLAKPRCN